MDKLGLRSGNMEKLKNLSNFYFHFDNFRVDDYIRGIFIEELASLDLSEATIKEGLRFAPPIPVIGRKCTAGCILGDFNIPKGTPILLSLYACLNDGKKWQYPRTFLPERHITEEKGRFDFFRFYCNFSYTQQQKIACTLQLQLYYLIL